MRKLPKLNLLLLVCILAFMAGCTGSPTPHLPTAPPTAQTPPAGLPTLRPAEDTPAVQTEPTSLPATSLPPTALPSAEKSSMAEVLASLEGLEINTFFEESFKQWILRDPEAVTTYGLAETYGGSNDQLTDISDAYIRDTQALEVGILALLKQYDRAALTPEEQLTADIYAWWLEDRVRGHTFMYNDYPVNQMIYSVPTTLLQFFTDIHPVTNVQDARDYVTRLSQVDDKFAQLIDGLKRREAAGVVLPKFLIGWTLGDLQSLSESTARSTPYYTTFAEKVRALVGVSDTDKQAVLEAAAQEIDASVIPAYRSLVEYIQALQKTATNDAGVWKFSNGEAYYAYLLQHHTSTDLSADEIHALGLQELERIHAEMRVLFDQLGYPKDGDLPGLYGRVAQEGGFVSGGQIVSTYEDIIETAGQKLDPLFDLRPQADVIVIGGPTGGYYMPPAFDGSRPGAFYASNTGSQATFAMPTLAYHEAIPGHHFQMAIAQELNLPSLRRGMDFTGYVEGWALFAERLAWELGFYENDPYGDLGRLQAEAFRAARLVVDTGLHAKQWTYDQAVDFMVENTGRTRNSVEYEVSRYIVIPGQATAYAVGYLKILELRGKAETALGDKFDLKQFHNILLGNGAMPLGILEKLVDEYIAANR